MGIQTAERVSHIDASDNYVYQRSVFAYLQAAEMIQGNILEIGTGSGYGVDIVSPKADHFTTVDKFVCDIDKSKYDNVSFVQCNVPPLEGFEDNQFDFVITFQVIEHIKPDDAFVKEIHRVLKPGGKLIVTTPNIKTTLSRNPWHIREYTVNQLRDLCGKYFSGVDTQGVYGNDLVMEYYEENKRSVNKIMRWDIFNLQYKLPRWVLQVPYDILNRMNRRKLLDQHQGVTAKIKSSDFHLAPAEDHCLDLFYICTK